MGLFTTKTGDCKNRCDADLGWNKDAKKACREACKGDNTLDPYTWLNGQPLNVQALYSYEVNQVSRIEQQAAQISDPSTAGSIPGLSGESSGPSIGIIVIAAVAVLAAILIIKKMKK